MSSGPEGGAESTSEGGRGVRTACSIVEFDWLAGSLGGVSLVVCSSMIVRSGIGLEGAELARVIRTT